MLQVKLRKLLLMVIESKALSNVDKSKILLHQNDLGLDGYGIIILLRLYFFNYI